VISRKVIAAKQFALAVEWFVLPVLAFEYRSRCFPDVTFPQSQYHFKDEISMLSRQLRERHWRQII